MKSCTLFLLLALISCGKDKQVKYVENPFDNTPNEERFADVVQIINPCPSEKATYEEVILKLQNNKYIAFFDNGGERFLTKLEKDVVYQTTDSRECKFMILENEVVEVN